MLCVEIPFKRLLGKSQTLHECGAWQINVTLGAISQHF